MTVEARLRDSTRAFTERIEPSLDGWQRLTDRLEPRPCRPWRVAAAGFVVVMVVSIVVVALARGGNDPLPASGAATYPKRVVVLNTEGQVLVLSARTGDFVRRLATGALVEGGGVVATDRRWVYFLGKRDRSLQCGPGVMSGSRILRVPLTGGRTRSVVSAPAVLNDGVASFDVSPDGKSLAFAVVTPGCGVSTSITTYDIATRRQIGHWQASSLPVGTTGGVSSLVWAPDSRHLMFVWEIGSSYPWIFDTATAKSLNDAYRVDIGDGSRLSGYLGSTGELFGLRFTVDGHRQVWSFDPGTGAAKRLLFCCGDPLASDRTGQAILAFDNATLVRWSAKNGRVVPVSKDVVAAVWVPERKP